MPCRGTITAGLELSQAPDSHGSGTLELWGLVLTIVCPGAVSVEVRCVVIQQTSHAIRHIPTEALIARHIDNIQVVQLAPGWWNGPSQLVAIHRPAKQQLGVITCIAHSQQCCQHVA